MAKVNYGTIVNDARGKVNGTVFSKNKSGAYTRRKVTPANPNSARQSYVRSNFAVLSQYWGGTLTDAQRAAWIAYAATYPRLDVFGAAIILTGLNMFISLNSVLANIGIGLNIAPPASNVVTPITFDPASFNPNTGAGHIYFDQSAAAPSADVEFYVFAQAPTSQGQQPNMSKMRFLGHYVGVAGPYPATVDLITEYVARYGNAITGQRISVMVATVDKTTGLTTIGTVMTGLAT